MPIDRIRAPYNFVPLAEWVFEPPWAKLASLDVPFKDGLSGSVSFRLSATTPILVGGGDRGTSGREARFFKTPDRTYAIPGSTVRGMVRNVLEIATFSKFRLLHDRRFAYRQPGDSQGYRRYFVTQEPGPKYRSKVYAGWLDFSDEEWRIVPCEYARIDQADIAKLVGSTKEDLFGKNPAAVAKYQAVETVLGGLDIDFDIQKDYSHHKKVVTKKGDLIEFDLIYDRALKVVKGGSGRLVFSGQPSPQKHLEFVFFERTSGARSRLVVSALVMREFEELLGDTKLDLFGKEKKNTGKDGSKQEELDTWSYLRSRESAVPVFYLTDGPFDGEVKHVGLTQLFKLPLGYEPDASPRGRSLHDAVRSVHQDHLEAGKYDFAETLFGFEGDETSGASALKGRVDFSLAKIRGNCQPMRGLLLALLSPQASFEPNYVRQHVAPSDPGKLAGKKYLTFGDKDAKPRGWKRYPARREDEQWLLPVASHVDEKFKTTLYPLPKSSMFGGTMRFHNLRPQELGALLWVLTWNRQENLRHRLGLGKPYGLGSAAIVIEQIEMLPNACQTPQQYRGEELDRALSGYISQFESLMDAAYRKRFPKCAWKDSVQVMALLAMADPRTYPEHLDQAQQKDGPYLVLDPDRKKNEFKDARENGLVLPEPADRLPSK